MKKVIVLILVCCMVVSVFAGCNKNNVLEENASALVDDEIEEVESRGNDDFKLKYDDRYVFENEISKIVTVAVKSKKVNTDKYDECVLSIVEGSQNKKVVANGVGTAEIIFKTGETLKVEVEAADISMLLIIGQSNAEGQIQPDTGNFDANTYQEAISQSIICEEGQVYSTYAPGLSTTHGNGVGNTTFSNTLSISNYGSFVASSLTSSTNIQGTELSYPLNSLTVEGQGKTGVDSGIAYQWNELRGEKVWVINASHGGSKISTWQAGAYETDNNFWQAVRLFGACQQVMRAEMVAGHYKLTTMGYFWLQGEADMNMTSDEYMENYKNMHLSLKEQLVFDKDLDGSAESIIDFGGIMMVRSCLDHTGKGDLKMRGVRIAQYCMGQDNTGEFRDVYLASSVTEAWTSDSAVKEYFEQKYGNSYPYAMRGNWSLPTTMTEIHPNIHYRQLGYNEIGLTSAQTVADILEGARIDASNANIKLLKEDGYTEFSENGVITLRAGVPLVAVPKCLDAVGKRDKIELICDLTAVKINAYTVTAEGISNVTEGSLYVKVNGKVVLTFDIEVIP